MTQEVRARTAVLLQQGGAEMDGTAAAMDLKRMVLNFKDVSAFSSFDPTCTSTSLDPLQLH